MDDQGKWRLNSRCKSKTMKIRICLVGIFALVTLAIAAPHTWILTSGKTVTGDYFSSGTTTLVVKTGGSNCFVKISELSTNDWLYFQECKAAQRQMQFDAEAKQMATKPGWMEFTAQLIKNFPEKVVDHPGWMDAYFQGLDNIYVDSKEDELGFRIRDKNNEYFEKCSVFKTDPHGKADPVIPEIMNLKRGDKVRFFGVILSGHYNTYTFYVSKIEMIESAADAAAVEEVKRDLENQAQRAEWNHRVDAAINAAVKK